jgi:hypothetical protein
MATHAYEVPEYTKDELCGAEATIGRRTLPVTLWFRILQLADTPIENIHPMFENTYDSLKIRALVESKGVIGPSWCPGSPMWHSEGEGEGQDRKRVAM